MGNPLCVITRLQGGLGNQMFQYAAGRALALRLGVSLKLDVGWFQSAHAGTPRDYALAVFPIRAGVAEEREIVHLRARENGRLHRRLRKLFGDRGPWRRIFRNEPHFQYWPGFERLKGPVHLEGYWQSERYFLSHREILRKDFAFPPLPPGPAVELREEIRRHTDAVSVHIRRGDYVSSRETAAFHGSCSPEYYRSALEAVSQGRPLRLFLFSDDPAWVREHFDTGGHSAVTVDLQEAAVHDMHLMSLCRHHITANSSFSWWGAWLGEEGGATCAPKRWFLEPTLDTKDLAPKRWLLIE